MGSRSDPETRQASLLLSGLVLTPDSALETFRERRVADKELDVAHLKRARDLLDYVSAAINSDEAERWTRIEQAWRLLQGKEEEEPPAVAVPPPRVTSPWGPAEPPRRPPPPPRPRAPTPPPMEPTEALDMDALKRDAEDDDELEGTMPVEGALKRSGLPFTGAVEPPPPASSGEGPNDMLGKTASLDPQEPREPTLPFNTNSLDSEDITTLHTRPSAPGSLLEVEPEPSSKMEPTERLDVRAHALPVAELPAHLGKLTLEQHAALTAECFVYPEWEEQIHARYGIQSTPERELLDDHFQALTKRDASLAEQWRWHYQRYESWARQRRR